MIRYHVIIANLQPNDKTKELDSILTFINHIERGFFFSLQTIESEITLKLRNLVPDGNPSFLRVTDQFLSIERERALIARYEYV